MKNDSNKVLTLLQTFDTNIPSCVAHNSDNESFLLPPCFALFPFSLYYVCGMDYFEFLSTYLKDQNRHEKTSRTKFETKENMHCIE